MTTRSRRGSFRRFPNLQPLLALEPVGSLAIDDKTDPPRAGSRRKAAMLRRKNLQPIDRQLPHPLSAAAAKTDRDRPTSALSRRSLKPNSAISKPTALRLAIGFIGCRQLFHRRPSQRLIGDDLLQPGVLALQLAKPPHLAHFQAAVPLAPPNSRSSY